MNTEDEQTIALNNAMTEDYDRQELDRVIAEVDDNQDDPDAWIGVSLCWSDVARLVAEIKRARGAETRWRADCPVTAVSVVRAEVTASMVNNWQWEHRPACRPCALPSDMAIAMAINRWALVVNRPPHDILDEIAAR